MNKLFIKLILGLVTMMALAVQAETQVDLKEFSFKNPNQPFANIITGGQPSINDLKKLKTLGFNNVVNLRTSGEFDGFNEAVEAKKLGLNYISLEIAGASGITVENAKELDRILKTLKGNSLVHCASSNRVGALFAIRASVVKGQTVEQALNIGKSAGLKSLFNKTQKLLLDLNKN